MRLSPPHARSSRCQHARARAVERVLFGGWGRTHTRWAGRPSSPVMGAAAFTPHRLNVGVSRRKPPRVANSVHRAGPRFEAERLVVTQGGFLRCASSAANLTPSLCVGCGSSFIVRVGAHRPLNRASMNLAPPALRQPAGAGAPSRQARRLPDLPAVLRRRLQASPSPRPSRQRAGGESPSAVSGARQEPRQAPPTASVGRHEASIKAEPFGWPPASLDPAARLELSGASVAARRTTPGDGAGFRGLGRRLGTGRMPM